MVLRVVPYLLAAFFPSSLASAYSQFTHEELIDLVWADSIQPLLLERYPGASDTALRRAHAFAYGGSLVQDIGYYPFGKRFFSNLAHYVRSGFRVKPIRSFSHVTIRRRPHHAAQNDRAPTANRAIAFLKERGL